MFTLEFTMSVQTARKVALAYWGFSKKASSRAKSGVDIDIIKDEVAQSRKLFAKLNCKVIDVTKKSVEETAARIIQLYREFRDDKHH